MSQAPFVIQPALTALALTYRNQVFIADDVLPRVRVASPSFKWSKFTLADGFTIPDTRVGRKSKPNEIDWSASEQNDSTNDQALDDVIPQYDIDAANASKAVYGVQPIDPYERSTTLLTDLVALDREARVAATIFNAGNYPAANKVTLSGTTQWSDAVNSDPLSAILLALDVPLIRPNIFVMGQAVWTQLRKHPKITAAAYPNGGNATGGPTAVQRQAIADLFELDAVYIGASFYNSAKPGQTVSNGRLWGKSAALLYVKPMAQTTNDVTFGFTAQWGDKIAGVVEKDPNIGMRGGTRVRVGEAVKEVIAASDVGYLFSAAVA